MYTKCISLSQFAVVYQMNNELAAQNIKKLVYSKPCDVLQVLELCVIFNRKYNLDFKIGLIRKFVEIGENLNSTVLQCISTKQDDDQFSVVHT